MRNQTLINLAKSLLKTLLSECTEGQQMMFRRMYSHKNLTLPIDEVVERMDVDKMDMAITQCERTIEKNKLLASQNQ